MAPGQRDRERGERGVIVEKVSAPAMTPLARTSWTLERRTVDVVALSGSRAGRGEARGRERGQERGAKNSFSRGVWPYLQTAEQAGG